MNIDNYLYNPWYKSKQSTKPQSSNVSKKYSSSNVSKKSKSSKVSKKSKSKYNIKWQQILILVIIMGTIATIIYFVVDSFKKKCPDPEKPVYDTFYKKCIPKCDPESEIYDDTLEECIPAQLCDSDLQAYFCPNITETCSGFPGCRCRAKQPYQKEYSCDLDDFICKKGLEECPPGGDLCCPDGLCQEFDGEYACCDEDKIYKPPSGGLDCCGTEQVVNEEGDGCVTTCRSLSTVYEPVPEDGFFEIPPEFKEDLNCDPNTTCVVIDKDPEDAKDIIEYIQELGKTDEDISTFRTNYIIVDDVKKLEIRFCKKNNECIFKAPRYYPSAIKNNYFFYNSKSIWNDTNIDDEYNISMKQLSEMDNTQTLDKIDKNFSLTTNSKNGYYCSDTSNPSYSFGRRVVYDEAQTSKNCDWENCFYISQLEGTNKIYWNPDTKTCVANQVPKFGAGQTTYCTGVGEPCSSCTREGEYANCVLCKGKSTPCLNCNKQGEWIPYDDCEQSSSDYDFGKCSTTDFPLSADTGFTDIKNGKETEEIWEIAGKCGINSYLYENECLCYIMGDNTDEHWGSIQPNTDDKKNCLLNMFGFCSGNGYFNKNEGEPIQYPKTIFDGDYFSDEGFLSSPKLNSYEYAFNSNINYYTLLESLYADDDHNKANYRRLPGNGNSGGDERTYVGLHLTNGITYISGDGANYDDIEITDENNEIGGTRKDIYKHTEYIHVRPDPPFKTDYEGTTQSKHITINIGVPGLYNSNSKTGKIIILDHYIGYMRNAYSTKRRHTTSLKYVVSGNSIFTYDFELYGILSYFEHYLLCDLTLDNWKGYSGENTNDIDSYPGLSIVKVNKNWGVTSVSGINYYYDRPNVSTGSSVFSQIYLGWTKFQEIVLENDTSNYLSIFKDNANDFDIIYPSLNRYIYMISRDQNTTLDNINKKPYSKLYGLYVYVVVKKESPYGLYKIIDQDIMVFNVGYDQNPDKVVEGEEDKDYYLFSEQVDLGSNWISIDYSSLDMKEATTLIQANEYNDEPFGKHFII